MVMGLPHKSVLYWIDINPMRGPNGPQGPRG
jgi:hypothetical protein